MSLQRTFRYLEILRRQKAGLQIKSDDLTSSSSGFKNNFINGVPTIINLEWHNFLEIGVDFIDDDHKNPLKIMLHVKDAIDDNNFSKCSILLTQLLKDAKEHFVREEEYLSKVKYPQLEDHKIYHKQLLIQAKTTKNICEGIETEHDLKECFENMANFLIDDILRGDIKFKSYLEHEGHIKRK